MARLAQRDPEAARTGSVAAAGPYPAASQHNPLRLVPGFLYILAAYIVGTFLFADPRAPLVEWRGYRISWTELLLVAAALVAMAEQLRVSHPGIDNTVESILIAGLAAVQVLLFALAAAGVSWLARFNSAEFLMLTLISLAQAVVAILINARTLRRSIGVGDSA